MQPLHWDLQPESQPAHRTTQENRFDLETTPAAAARTQEVPFLGLQPLTRKNTRFPAPASSPKQAPCNSYAAITLRFKA